jgi:hypothetical protein
MGHIIAFQYTIRYGVRQESVTHTGGQVRNLTPDQVAAKWNTRAGAAQPDWVSGVQAVTVSPGQKAAAQADAYIAGVNAGLSKWKTKLSQMTAADWSSITVAKGQGRYSAGVTAAQPKYQTAITKVLNAEKSIVASLPARGGLENNIARSAAFQRAMSAAAANGQLSA